MQEIDKNTDEEAHKFKVQEMKRVADMLEKNVQHLKKEMMQIISIKRNLNK